jgi:FAD/FMN-containing dehydrogenase
MTNGHVYPGGRVDRDDARYDTLRRGFNLRWVGDPAEIAICGDAEQVRAVVQRAVHQHLRLTVRSGGHCYENFAVQNDGGILVDMAAMNRVYYDNTRRAYCIEAGTTLWNAIWTLYKEYGRAIPDGSCYSVGAGGHVTGGGYGLLSRKYGLIVDHLTAVELVHVTREGRAEIVIAGKDGSDDERDLLWANQGGGGGNFGIVTRFWFDDLPPAPSEAYVVNLAWNWSDMTEDELALLNSAYGQFSRPTAASTASTTACSRSCTSRRRRPRRSC